MAEHLADDIDRLQRLAVSGNHLSVECQLVSHRLQHCARVVEFGGKAMIEVGRDVGHEVGLEDVSLRSGEQHFGDRAGDRVSIETVGAVEIGERSGLTEAVHPKRGDALATHSAEP